MKQVLVGGVSATIAGEDKAHGKSEVMSASLVHGRTRSKEDSLRFANISLKAVPHLVCVTWDSPNHGSRLTDPESNTSWSQGNPSHMSQMQAIIDQGSVEAADSLEMVPAQLPDINITKRVIIGVSLGGYITWNVAANHTSLSTAAIPIISSPNTSAVMRERWEKYAKSEPERAAQIYDVAFDPAVVAKMEKDAERSNGSRSTNSPILAICGGDDPSVPAKFSIKWGESARPHQRVEIVPGVKHEVPREIMDLTEEYLISIMTRV